MTARIEGHVLAFRPIAESELLRWSADSEIVRFFDEPLASIGEARTAYLGTAMQPVWQFVVERSGRGIG